MDFLTFLTVMKEAEEGFSAIQKTGKSLFNCYKDFKEIDLKIRLAFATGDRQYFNDKSRENLLYYYLFFKHYRVIILCGVESGGKTMLIDNISKRIRCEKFNFIDQRDLILLSNTSSSTVLLDSNLCVPDDPVFDDNFVIVDNIKTLDNSTMDMITRYANGKKIIIACRNYEIDASNNYGIVKFDFNKYRYVCKKSTRRVIDRKIWRKLPSYMKKPLFIELLSNKLVSEAISNDRDFAQRIINLCNFYYDYSSVDPKKFIYDFLDEIFTLLSDEEVRLLMLYSLVMKDCVYNEDMLRVFFRKLRSKSFLSDRRKVTGSDDTFVVDTKPLKKLSELFKVKYGFLVGQNGEDIYLHRLFCDYFAYRFQIMEEKEKLSFINNKWFLYIVSNINWQICDALSGPFDKKIRYITYAHNLVEFFDRYNTLIKEKHKHLVLLKRYMHLVNSYALIMLKISALQKELGTIRIRQKELISIIQDEKIKKNWIRQFGNSHYYRALSEFCHIAAKIAVAFAIFDDRNIYKDIFSEAIQLMNIFSESIDKIQKDSKYYLERKVYYHATMAVMFYKAAILQRQLKCIRVDGKRYCNAKIMLEKSKEEILVAIDNNIQLLKDRFNLDINLHEYDFSAFIKQFDLEHLEHNWLTSLFILLRIECIINYLLLRDFQNKDKDYEGIMKFTFKGFYKISSVRMDTMRCRIALLIMMLYSDGNDLDMLNERLNMLSAEIDGARNNEVEYNKYLLLKSLVYCIKKLEYDEHVMKKLCLIYCIDYEDIVFESSVKYIKLENIFFKFVTE
ncbi:MAG: hypothetical protein E7513_07635 [Ruminococcaceae bacterium]|nr:hypothetical protein [Oscillospiraceae bacterium]